MSSKKLVVASRNIHKIAEIKAILQDLPLEIKGVDEVATLPDVVEDGDTFAANACKKATVIAKAVNSLVLADDSGLEVDWLRGAPGVYSARFAGEPANDQRNNEKLLALLRDVPWEARSARFQCVIAVAWPDGQVETCSGSCPGKIGFVPRGEGGFGYDSLFYVEDYDQTFAEMSAELKNKISHRARALAQLHKLFAINFSGNC